jgi:hypothetical protein
MSIIACESESQPSKRPDGLINRNRRNKNKIKGEISK